MAADKSPRLNATGPGFKRSRPAIIPRPRPANAPPAPTRRELEQRILTFQLPELRPWPPLVPTGFMVCPDAYVAPFHLKPQSVFADHLRDAVKPADPGYGAIKYYRRGDGFAMWLPLEQIDAGGHPLKSPDRWLTDKLPFVIRIFSTGDWWERLWTEVPVARFRQIVLIVTEDAEQGASTPQEIEELKDIYTRGAATTDDAMTRLTLLPNQKMFVLHYEFIVPKGRKPKMVFRSGATMQEHLLRSNLMICGVR